MTARVKQALALLHAHGFAVERIAEIRPRDSEYLFVFMADHRSQLNGTLGSLATFGHLGAGGSCVWADPATGVLGVYLSVAPQLDHNDLEVLSCDLFQNAVHAAVVS